MENEVFKPCKQDNKFLIGNYGTLKRTDETIIKRYGTAIVRGAVKPDGYKMYWIAGKWEYAHRLVGQHFIPNPDNLPEINHYDGNKLNNYETNLEWVTHSQNHKHRFEVLGHKMPQGEDHYNFGREVPQTTRKLMSEAKIGSKHPKFKGWYCYGGERYGSSYEAAKATGFNYKTLTRYAKDNINGWSYETV